LVPDVGLEPTASMLRPIALRPSVHNQMPILFLSFGYSLTVGIAKQCLVSTEPVCPDQTNRTFFAKHCIRQEHPLGPYSFDGPPCRVLLLNLRTRQ